MKIEGLIKYYFVLNAHLNIFFFFFALMRFYFQQVHFDATIKLFGKTDSLFRLNDYSLLLAGQSKFGLIKHAKRVLFSSYHP